MDVGQGAVGSFARIAAADPSEAYTILDSKPDGLAVEEARRRLRTYGPNELPAARKVGLGRKLLDQFRNLFNVLLLIAAGLSFLIGVGFVDPSSVQMGYAILAVVLFNAAFSIVQEYRAERTIEALRRLIPANAKVRRNGTLVEIPISQLVPGDVIAIEQGERVPADARLTSAFGISVDHSALTGESDPVPRTADGRQAPDVTDPTGLANLIFAGTTVAAGSGTAVVLATGTRTRFGQIVARTQEVRPEASPLQREISRTGRTNFAIAVLVGLVFLALAVLVRGLHILGALVFMIGVMISLVPEGFQLTVTLSLALSSLSMAKSKVVTKQLASVEALGSTTVICTDKTGTVTTGQMTVRRAWIAGEWYVATGEGFDPEGSVRKGGKQVRAEGATPFRRACEVAVLNSQASLVPPLDRTGRRWTAIGDTTEAALLAFAIKAGVDPKGLTKGHPRLGLIPFESARKMMTSVHRTPGGVVAYTKGAGREVLDRCVALSASSEAAPLTRERRAEIEAQVDDLAKQAYRVLALAYRPLPSDPTVYTSETVERDLIFLGLVAIQDPPRPESAEAVRTARNAGVRVIMLTGDHELTAEAIARQVGLLTYQSQPVVSGARLAEMSDRELSAVVDAPEAVFARITPEQKHRVVKALKARGEIVAVTGDGVNDAPALAEADVGIAMGITGTDVAREAADMILLDDNFASIVRGVEVGRGVFDNLRRFITYVFTHNWAQLVSFVAFVLLGVPPAITVLYILSIDLVMEIPISLALTLEPPGPHVMQRPPRPYGSRLFDRAGILTSTYLGVIVGIGALLAAFSVWSQGGWSYGMDRVPDGAAYIRGGTVVVAAIMLGQLGNFLSRRADPGSAVSLSPLRNRWLFPGVLATLALLLLIVYAPPLQAFFGTAPLTAGDWLLVLPFAALALGLEQSRLAVERRLVPVPTPRRAVPLPDVRQAVHRVDAEARWRESFPRWARGPLVLPVLLRPGDRAAILVALRVAAAGGSKVVIVPLHRGGDPRKLAEREQAIQKLASEAGVRIEYVRRSRAGMPTGPKQTADAIAEVAKVHGATAIILAAGRDPLSRNPLGRVAECLPGRAEASIIFVRAPRASARSWPAMNRIMIAVLQEFHPEPFEVADLLTAGQTVPDIGVVIARVIRIPSIVPLYSTYTPDSLVDAEAEMSFLRRVRRGRARAGERRVLLVRDVSRDLGDFAREREVDAILMWGDRDATPRIVLRDEESLVENPPCPVLIVLSGPRVPGEGEETEGTEPDADMDLE